MDAIVSFLTIGVPLWLVFVLLLVVAVLAAAFSFWFGFKRANPTRYTELKRQRTFFCLFFWRAAAAPVTTPASTHASTPVRAATPAERGVENPEAGMAMEEVSLGNDDQQALIAAAPGTSAASAGHDGFKSRFELMKRICGNVPESENTSVADVSEVAIKSDSERRASLKEELDARIMVELIARSNIKEEEEYALLIQKVHKEAAGGDPVVAAAIACVDPSMYVWQVKEAIKKRREQEDKDSIPMHDMSKTKSTSSSSGTREQQQPAQGTSTDQASASKEHPKKEEKEESSEEDNSEKMAEHQV